MQGSLVDFLSLLDPPRYVAVSTSIDGKYRLGRSYGRAFRNLHSRMDTQPGDPAGIRFVHGGLLQ